MFDYLVGNNYMNPLLRVAATVTKDLYEGRSYKDNSYTDWLKGDWNEDKYSEYLLYTVLPGMSQYTQFLTDWIDDQSYMDRHGIDWSRVKRPWKLKSTSSASSGVRYALNFVSKNVDKLY